MVKKMEAKIRDFQLFRYFFGLDIDLHEDIVESILDCKINVKPYGEPDTMIDRGNTIIYHNPSTPTKFLFNILYTTLTRHISKPEHRDKLGLGLYTICTNYVYEDSEIMSSVGPPVVIGFEKIVVPNTIIQELVNPLVGPIKTTNLLFTACQFTDTCRMISNEEELHKQYNFPRGNLSPHNFPLMLVNTNIQNKAAQLAGILLCILQSNLGKDKTQALLKNILLDESKSLINKIITIVRIIEGDPGTVINFVKLLQSYAGMSVDDNIVSNRLQIEAVTSDKYLKNNIKIAASDAYYTPEVRKQWTEWAIMLGLLEERLQGVRGPMWPSTQTMKPHDDEKKKMFAKKRKEKGKNLLNFEEMLEVARDVYNHRTDLKGKLTETMLKDKRVW
jgi:hypothetical protein